MVLAAAGLKAGQEDYWIRQIAESRCEYLSGHGETPGQWYGARAAALGLAGTAKDEQCHAMFAGKDPITGEQVAQPKWVADPRSKLPAGPLAEQERSLTSAPGSSPASWHRRATALPTSTCAASSPAGASQL